MPLIVNGSPISPGSKILCNDIDLQKIYCNDILIWQKYTNSSGAVSGYFSFEFSTSMIANSASPGDKNETYSRGTMSGDVLSWGSKGAIVKANCDCKVTVFYDQVFTRNLLIILFQFIKIILLCQILHMLTCLALERAGLKH